MENKVEVFIALIKALKLTRAWDKEIRYIKYDADAEVVEINYNGTLKRQSVWGDSGLAFIRDIVNNLEA